MRKEHLTEGPDFYVATEGRSESKGGGPPRQQSPPPEGCPSLVPRATGSRGWTSARQRVIHRRGHWTSRVHAVGILR